MENLEYKIQELSQRYQELQGFVKNIDQEKSRAVTEMVKIEGAVEVLRGLIQTEAEDYVVDSFEDVPEDAE